MPEKYIIANWKMHGLRDGSTQLVKKVVDFVIDSPDFGASTVVLCPPFTLLRNINIITTGSNVKLGAQNCHHQPKGAFTGDISAEMLRDMGCSHVILGHSERRNAYGETNEMVKQKAIAAYAHNLNAVICVGESKEERESGKALEVVGRQVMESIAEGLASPKNTIIAYEPVWAIGTGTIPTSQEIAEIHQHIAGILIKSCNFNAPCPIIYGGSVKSSNANTILQTAHVDGVLVGGASLDFDQFSGILNAAAEFVDTGL